MSVLIVNLVPYSWAFIPIISYAGCFQKITIIRIVLRHGLVFFKKEWGIPFSLISTFFIGLRQKECPHSLQSGATSVLI